MATLDFPKAKNFSLFQPSPHCSFNGIAHYSWDYAQQLHYPANPQQPGPIYFKTPRKFGIFGIVNKRGSRTTKAFFHADNCTGTSQNIFILICKCGTNKIC